MKRWLVYTNFVVIMVVGGYMLYLLSTAVPLPGSKFIFMGPFLTFVMMIPLERYPKFGTLSIINGIFGLVMLVISPWMTLAIIIAGVVSDLLMLLPIKMKIRCISALGVYNMVSLLVSVYITNSVTGNMLYEIVSPTALIVATIISFLTGALGANLGNYVNKKYLKHIQ